jgi:hypothetical protein
MNGTVKFKKIMFVPYLLIVLVVLFSCFPRGNGKIINIYLDDYDENRIITEEIVFNKSDFVIVVKIDSKVRRVKDTFMMVDVIVLSSLKHEFTDNKMTIQILRDSFSPFTAFEMSKDYKKGSYFIFGGTISTMENPENIDKELWVVHTFLWYKLDSYDESLLFEEQNLNDSHYINFLEIYKNSTIE